MKKALFLLLFAQSVFAGEATLSWTPATQNEDATPYTDPDGYILYYGTESGTYTNQVRIQDSAITDYTVEDLAAGQWYFVITSVNQAGIESIYSGEAVKDVLPAAPNPPTNLTVQEDNLTAYGISQSKDRLVVYPVGTVAPDTACDSSMTANGLYLVPADSVSYAGTVRPAVVLAACSGG